MNAAARHTAFSTANPHALATILEASETKSIIAARDIFELSGTLLWARDQPVSRALQRTLLDRRLREPLESCLLVEDGVTSQALVLCTQALVERDTPLAALLRPYAARIVQEVAHLPLHPVGQLLLSAGQASHPESFDHAVQAMALAGALTLDHGGGTPQLRLAMLAGLLHDLGEMYIDPRCGEVDADRLLDLQSYRQLVVHPHVGRLLITQLTDYPATLARAIGEHHERLDGSGYPHALQRDAVSPLGRMLAVTEASLAVLRSERPELSRVSIALRVVPGEFDLSWVGRIAAAVGSQPALQSQLDAAQVQSRLTRLETALQSSIYRVDALMAAADSPALQSALGLAQHLLSRLRAGWYASGLWCSQGVQPQDAAEVEAVEDELFFRLHAIARAAQLRAGELEAADLDRLDMLCDTLRAVQR